jgi:hypothetical protein
MKSLLKKHFPALFKFLKRLTKTNYYILLNLPKISAKDYSRPILKDEEGSQLIYDLLTDDQPRLICRMGSAELVVLLNHHFLENGKLKEWDYDKINQGLFRMNAVFPNTAKTLQLFSNVYLSCLPKIDAFGVWYNYGEHLLHQTYFSSAPLFPLESLEPFRFPIPWSSALAGKKVLVVLPFVASVKKQYKNRHVLFENKDVLPACELIVYRPFNSYTDEPAVDCDWFWYLEQMKEQIEIIDFDIALIAAGPFGLPLAAAIKNMGKKAVHVGGALQLLFGIKGSRWEERPEFKTFINDQWIKPSGDEVPLQKVKTSIDNGSYW